MCRLEQGLEHVEPFWATSARRHVILPTTILTVRANFREKIRIEISSWNERTNHNHPRTNRRYSGHHRLSPEDACGRIDRQTLPDQWQLDGLESGADVGGLVNLYDLRR